MFLLKSFSVKDQNQRKSGGEYIFNFPISFGIEKWGKHLNKIKGKYESEIYCCLVNFSVDGHVVVA